ncbi:RDD family protein [Kitasatospora sp. NPDC096204]|uniref:RDD family protein n=1 Tax=Kitasatospora sp. NPDC096204 TaxID=3364094 RepID=UPI00380F2FFB
MTDRPFVAHGDPAVAPEPGYYPDPSIPGFVRYWGGAAWVPGTSRPAPAGGEMLEPPRYVTRRPAPGGAAVRAVPPPVVPGAALPGVVGAGVPEPVVAEPVVPGPTALGAVASSEAVASGAVASGAVASGAVASGAVAEARAGLPVGGGDTGPVYFDQTSGGASFVLGPRVAEVIGGPVFRTVDGPGASPGLTAGVPAIGVPAPGVLPAGVSSGFAGAEPPQAAPAQAPAAFSAPPVSPSPSPSPFPSDSPAQGFGESGWQADPRAQRGLMDTGDAPRWVSWGVLPEALDAQDGRAEPEHTPAAAELAAAGAPVVAVAMREAPVPAVLTSGPVPVIGEEAVAAARPAPGPDAVAVASKSMATAAVAATAPVAPLPAVRTLRETAVQPRPSASAATVSASSGAARAAGAAGSARTGRAARAGRNARAAEPAGLGRRLAARAVDTAVLLVVAVAAGVPLGRSVTDHLQRKVDQARMASVLARRQVQVWLVDDVVLGKIAVLLGILLFVSLLYEVLPVARTGQTFGKRLARIRVVDAAAPAARARLSLGRSLLRWVVRQAGTVLLLGLVWPVFDRTARRGWQDRAARTRVVRG